MTITQLESRVKSLEEKCASLEGEVAAAHFGAHWMKGDNRKCRFWTGLPTYDHFEVLVCHLTPKVCEMTTEFGKSNVHFGSKRIYLFDTLLYFSFFYNTSAI